jgi:hypothetical protein
MHGIPFSPEATNVEFDEDSMWVTLEDGRRIGVPLAFFPRLMKGSPAARRDFFISPSGIHWEQLDEDVSIASLLANRLGTPAPARAA